MYRLVALVCVVAAVGCGGGSTFGAIRTPTPDSTSTPTEAVAGAKVEPTVSPTAVPTPGGTYTVADGDTLSDIAARFNTTVEALVAANALANPDELSVGQVLTIAAATPEPAGTPSPAATATATPTQ